MTFPKAGRRSLFAVLSVCAAAGVAWAGHYGGGGKYGSAAQSQSQLAVGQGSPSPQSQNGGGSVNQSGTGGAPVLGQTSSAGMQDKMTAGPPGDAAAAAEESAPAAPTADPVPVLTLADAADDFKTVVESYLAKSTIQGVWLYKEKAATSRLSLLEVDAASVRAAGKGLYSGDVVFRDLRTKKKRRLEFKTDLGGSDWRVVSVRPSPPPAR